jgi:hypothetical protein
MKWGKMTSKSNMKYHVKKIFSRATNFSGDIFNQACMWELQACKIA